RTNKKTIRHAMHRHVLFTIPYLAIAKTSPLARPATTPRHRVQNGPTQHTPSKQLVGQKHGAPLCTFPCKFIQCSPDCKPGVVVGIIWGPWRNRSERLYGGAVRAERPELWFNKISKRI